jgi:hypothetical protein
MPTINKTERIAELMNWPAYRAEMAIKHANVPEVNKYVEILEASEAAGAFLPEAKEIPEWYYRDVNDKPKNLGNEI